MKIYILRETAIKFLSIHLTLQIDNLEILRNELLDTGEEFNEDNILDPRNIDLIVELNEFRLKGVTNQYLVEKIGTLLLTDLEIVGTQFPMYACPCCGFNTLMERGTYDICEICKWEDSGDVCDNEYSSPNRMTLGDAKSEFTRRLCNHSIDEGLLTKYYYDKQ